MAIYSKGKAANISLGCKWLAVTTTLAYNLTGSLGQAYSLGYKYQTSVEVTVSDKHTSLAMQYK